MRDSDFPTMGGILAASRTIDPVFTGTPLVEQATANAALGLRVLAKVETLNPIRSFKGRGTDWYMASLPPSDAPIISASAGNFGQGLARAAARRGRRVVIFAATTANPLKLEAMRRLGAEVMLAGDDFDAAKGAARRHANEVGGLFVEDGAERTIAEGAGTIAAEITDALTAQGLAPDLALIPLGNGALLTGMGTWLKARAPGCRVIGVVAAEAPAMKLSFEDDSLITTARAPTQADGIAVREPVPYALAAMRATVDAVVAVDEQAIVAAMRFCRRHYGLVVEPAGAAGIAALIQHGERLGKGIAVTPLCGSNVVDAEA